MKDKLMTTSRMYKSLLGAILLIASVESFLFNLLFDGFSKKIRWKLTIVFMVNEII